MNYIEILLLSTSVSLDTFAVSLCKGMEAKNLSKTIIVCSIWFCAFQLIMPLAGYFAFKNINTYIESFDHWIAFGLFLILGINMIKESFSKNKPTADLNFKTMFTLSLATSIDSLMLGITLSLLEFSIFPSTAIIVCCTLISVVIGSIIGYKFGTKYKKISNIIGGIILILMGIKVLIEHLL